MRIYAMTATFGKLEHETLTLTPGLNVIHAPNEWGKSTWCAFLLAMLYGVDTRAKSTRGKLSDKDHYTPWSGSPMSGRIELNWQGRDITIERTTRGRIPMGYFRAYETDSGIAVPELTAENCGQLLLGVERSVYRRAGFIRLSDLPVSEDEALRRRLNALVTTGDESGDGVRLERGLKELKNRCRYNQSGLLPQAEAERQAIRNALVELEALEYNEEKLLRTAGNNDQQRQRLKKHLAALSYEEALADARRVEAADRNRQEAAVRLATLEDCCAQVPDRETAAQKLGGLHAHLDRLRSFQLWQQSLPLPPEMPKIPRAFLGMEPQEAMEQVQRDTELLQTLAGPIWWLLLVISGLMLTAASCILWLGAIFPAAICGVLCLLFLALGILRKQGQDRGYAALTRKYGSAEPERWQRMAQKYAATLEGYRNARQEYRRSREELAARRDALKQERTTLCGDEGVEEAREYWQQISQSWNALEEAREDVCRAEEQYSSILAMARPLPEPVEDDTLTCSRDEALQLLQEAREEQHRLQNQLGQIRGRMEALGSKVDLQKKLTALEDRIEKLEKTNAALMLAQQTLNKATAELQRRFAPRIAKQAQSLMSRMTGGRYDRMNLDNDLSLQAGTRQEDTLHDAQWRSEGTIDQLYLALRLCVAEELTPDAPLVLDDALVRFDDERMKAAMDILRELAEKKQVILFSCQTREADCL